MLELEHVYSGYGEVKVISDVSLVVNGGEIVTLIGANGVGKSTLLKTISHVGKASCERGTISFDGNDITNKPPYKVIELGLLQIPEGRQIINELTVRENLILGCYVNYRKLGSSGRKKLLDHVFELFPVLRDRMDQISGTLSGGEQQMLAVSRALMG